MNSVEASRGYAASVAILTGAVLAMMAALPIWAFVLVAEGEMHVAVAAGVTIVMLPLVAFLLAYVVISLQALFMRGPVITIGPDGFRDRRVSSTTVPWDRLRWYRQTKTQAVANASRGGGVYHLDVISFDVVGPYAATPHYRLLSVFHRMVRNLPWRVMPLGFKTPTAEIARTMAKYSAPIEPPKR